MTTYDSDGYGNLLDSSGNIIYIQDSSGLLMYDSTGSLVLAPQEVYADSASGIVAADSSDNLLIDADPIPKKYISHRGNLTGPVPFLENTVDHIDSAIRKGFFCEVDVWKVDNKLILSHDEPTDIELTTKQVGMDFFRDRQDRLLIHCKNSEALLHFIGLMGNKGIYNYFYHDSDAYNMTSHMWIIAYPGKPIPLDPDVQPTTIAMMPEIHNTDTTNFLGICSDYIENYYNSGA